MNSALSDYLQKSTGYTESTISNVVEAFCKFIQVSMRQGNEVKIEKFGSFYTKDMPGRKGRNPKTGEEITIAPKRKADFKFSKIFIELIQPDSSAEPSTQTATPDEPATTERKVPPPVPANLMPGSSKSWFVSIDGKSQEVEEKDLPKFANPETPLWSEETGWKLAKDILSLAYLFNKAA